MLIATFALPPEAVALDETLRVVPGIEVEAERIAAHSTAWTMPCLWVSGADFAAVEPALRDDPTVDDIVETYEYEDETYVQIVWSDAVVDRIDAYTDRAASILEAAADDDGWQLQIRFATREQLEHFRESLRDQGHGLDLLELTTPGSPRQTTGHVTPGQRDALVAAMERGFYEVPREISAEELAAELGISQQALSERLRRGIDSLVDSTLATDGETGATDGETREA